MKILHLLDTSLPVISGYSSRSRSIVEAQKRAGLQPTVLTSPRYAGQFTPDRETVGGIDYYRSPPRGESGLASELASFRKRIVEVCREVEPDVLHAHSPILTGLPAWRAARAVGRPCVYEMRSSWEDASVEKGEISESSMRYRLSRAGETFLLKRVDAATCICDGLRTDIISRGIPADKVTVVGNGIDVSRFQASAPDPDVLDKFNLQGKVVIGYVGTFFGFEGVIDLVEAIARLIEQGNDNVAGLIVGKGSTYEACAERARELGLEDRIVHPGHVSPDEVQKIYAAMDILVYPRRSYRITEMVTPLKPLEAMAMKKVTVGSDVGGIRELIEDGKTGLIFRSGDVDDLAAKLQRLIDDPVLRERLIQDGYDWVSRERDWDKLVALYEPVYRSLLDG